MSVNAKLKGSMDVGCKKNQSRTKGLSILALGNEFGSKNWSKIWFEK